MHRNHSLPGSSLVTHCLAGSHLPVFPGNPKRERAAQSRSSLKRQVWISLGRQEPAVQWGPRRESGNQGVAL